MARQRHAHERVAAGDEVRAVRQHLDVRRRRARIGRRGSDRSHNHSGARRQRQRTQLACRVQPPPTMSPRTFTGAEGPARR